MRTFDLDPGMFAGSPFGKATDHQFAPALSNWEQCSAAAIWHDRCVVKFTFRRDNGQHVGGGVFLVSDDGNRFGGYYVENLDVDDLNQERVERGGEPWCFTGA